MVLDEIFEVNILVMSLYGQYGAAFLDFEPFPYSTQSIHQVKMENHCSGEEASDLPIYSERMAP